MPICVIVKMRFGKDYSHLCLLDERFPDFEQLPRKLKRKSHPQTDEVEDGARAILIEEGISHLVFKYAEKNHFLRDDKRGDTALLKTIKAIVDGLEVQDRPLALWEKAIRDGFAVFRLLQQHRRGRVLITVDASSVTFAKITDD